MGVLHWSSAEESSDTHSHSCQADGLCVPGPPCAEASTHWVWFGASGVVAALFCPQYGIVLDAGSSHTNLYVYEWPAEKENDTGVVKQVEVCKVEGKRRKRSWGRGVG